MFNAKEWIEQTKETCIYNLLIIHAYVGFALMKELTEEQYFAIVAEAEFKKAKEQSAQYLLTLYNEATPETLKQAKKSLKGYIEQQIFKDQTSGKITSHFADQAKTALPEFLTKNKTVGNER